MAYYVHETAEVENGAVIGDNTKIWNQAQVRRGGILEIIVI